MRKQLLIAAFLLLAALPVAAAVTSTLPYYKKDGTTRMPAWQTGGYEISEAAWSAANSTFPGGCLTEAVPKGSLSTLPSGAVNPNYKAKEIDKCSTNAYIPEAQRSSARCETVRVHRSATEITDQRACAACTGGSCKFFLISGTVSSGAPTSTTKPPTTTTPTPTPTPTQPGPGTTDGTQGGTGFQNGTGGNGTNPDANGDGCPDNFNLLPKGACTLSGVLDIILALVVQVGTILLVLALVWTGFLFIKAQGAEEELRSARSALLWVVLGGLLLLGAQAMKMVVSAAIESL